MFDALIDELYAGYLKRLQDEQKTLPVKADLPAALVQLTGELGISEMQINSIVDRAVRVELARRIAWDLKPPVIEIREIEARQCLETPEYRRSWEIRWQLYKMVLPEGEEVPSEISAWIQEIGVS